MEEKIMEDREMHKATCTDCGKQCEVPFKPTPGKPVRCSDCFKKSSPRRNNFGGNRGNNRGRFGGGNRRFGNNRNNRDREMHKATCADCGKECEVPFKPTSGKPVYCRDCYNNKN
ncbi:MAG: CxxC-x17-CxxC domain-containing protein [Nanoarchaeota archaeon]